VRKPHDHVHIWTTTTVGRSSGQASKSDQLHLAAFFRGLRDRLVLRAYSPSTVSLFARIEHDDYRANAFAERIKACGRLLLLYSIITSLPCFVIATRFLGLGPSLDLLEIVHQCL
jgi:hypothetical protein